MSSPLTQAAIADVFCRVIDNHGDMGVCWRLSQRLSDKGWHVRLWVDDASALTWMAPERQEPDSSSATGVVVRDWNQARKPHVLAQLAPARLWVEGFGCELPHEFIEHAVQHAKQKAPRWVNLEYLSAQDWVPRMHGLPSPVMTGPAKGWSKQFIYPGFVNGTGGLLREPDLLAQQASFNANTWWANLGLNLQDQSHRVSLFCYEPPVLARWLRHLSQHRERDIDLLVTPGRSRLALEAAQVELGWSAWPAGLRIHHLPWLSQIDFDRLLWACDFNCVRGEDSLVRAIWAGQAFLWQIYVQDDLAHHEKLNAFLQRAQFPRPWVDLHHLWNGMTTAEPAALPTLTSALLNATRESVRQLRSELMRLPALEDAVLGLEAVTPRTA